MVFSYSINNIYNFLIIHIIFSYVFWCPWQLSVRDQVLRTGSCSCVLSVAGHVQRASRLIYSFSGAVVVKYHNLGGLNNINALSHSS